MKVLAARESVTFSVRPAYMGQRALSKAKPSGRRMANEARHRGKRRCNMRAMARLWKWWRALWELDLCSSMEIDSHLWENKSEMRRRLAGS